MIFKVSHTKLNDEIIDQLKILVDEIGYVVIKTDNKIDFIDFISKWGSPIELSQYGFPVQGKILKLEPFISKEVKLNGFSFGEIPPHTDIAFLDSPVEYVFIKMNSIDPFGKHYGRNGIVDVFRIVERLRGSNLLDKLCSVKFPFFNRKVNKIIKQPLIILDENERLKLVRFHIDRIMSVYRTLGIKPTNEENYLLNKFLELAYKNIKYVELEENDILIVDNHLMLHSRTECNFVLKGNEMITREVEVAFVRKNN
jgi:alpha-ketoglutarate-dependent taurine dioxygenase